MHTLLFIRFLKFLRLVGSVTATIFLQVLVISLINHFVPDPLSSEYYPYGLKQTLRVALSVTVVLIPVIALINWYIHKTETTIPEIDEARKTSKSSYTLIALSVISIAGSIITAVYQFLSGGLTIQFLLETVFLLILCIIITHYFYNNLRPVENQTFRRIYNALILIISILIIITSFSVVGFPQDARKADFDSKKVSELERIRSIIESNYTSEPELTKDPSVEIPVRNVLVPESLQDLTASNEKLPAYQILRKEEILDDQTGQEYEYKKISEDSYELCAIFNTNTKDNPTDGKYSYSYGIFAEHEAGRVCKTINVR